MCLIVWNKAGKSLDKEKMQAAFNHNNDGVGIMWAEGGEVKVVKGCYTFESIWKFLSENFEGVPHAIHFRMGTQGLDNDDNCHPYEIIKKDLYIMHNGILTEFSTGDAVKSDTWLFAEHLTKKINEGKLSKEDLFNPKVIKELETRAGWNKFLFMDGQGNVSLVNESAGSWINDVWYSNSYSMYSYSSYSHRICGEDESNESIGNTKEIEIDIESIPDGDFDALDDASMATLLSQIRESEEEYGWKGESWADVDDVMNRSNALVNFNADFDLDEDF